MIQTRFRGLSRRDSPKNTASQHRDSTVILKSLIGSVMAPSTAKKSAASKKSSARQTTKKATDKTATKPKDKNRVFKSATGEGSYNEKAVEARRAKDAHITDKFHEDFSRQEKLIRRGPTGRPIYDTQGFELDYDKVSKAMRPPRSRNRSSKAYLKMLETEQTNSRSIEKIVGLPEGGLYGTTRWAIQDRVARDLGLPYHKIGMDHYSSWSELDFEVDPEDFKLENITEAEKERLSRLATGSALRK
jgi:hypothetical protein